MTLDLAGRTVCITGAAGGLGAELAQELAGRGAHLALLDLDPAAVGARAAAIGDASVVRGWAADVRDLGGLRRVMADVADHFGGIDVVVAAAGVLGPLETLTVAEEADWDRVVDINLNGVWRTFKAALPHVTRRRGHLVAMSSMIAYVHPPLLGSYAASKAGVAAFCDALRLELRPAGVTVTSVHPAIFRTPMIGDALGSPAAAALVNDFTGVFRTVELETVVRDLVRGIERRAPRVVSPRPHGITALVPGLAQALLERLAFRPRRIGRALELGSLPRRRPTAAATPTPTEDATVLAPTE